MPGGPGRETSRPPWVKDAKGSIPAKETPAWTLRKRTSNAQDTEMPAAQNAVEEQLASVKASLKKQTTRNKSENGVTEKKNDDGPEKVMTKLKELPSKEKKAEPEKTKKPSEPQPKETVTPKKPPVAKPPPKEEVVAKKPPVLQRQASKEEGVKKWRDPLIEKAYEKIDNTLNEVPKGHTLTKNESLRSLLKPLPPPMPPPMPPKLPPPPEFKKPPPTATKLKKIESLKSRPRRRPDWSDMMKEVETGIKLKHIVCNDRSSPIITKSAMVKAKGQYVYESEKGNMHNQLLKQINQGVKLKNVKTNDRSKPILEGLRKFRRQMTIEEQLQKSMSQVNMLQSNMSQANIAEKISESEQVPPEEDEVDEMDDIDKVRDDLQSTKQLLALELRNKEAMQRENKRLLARIANMEAELKSERAHVKQEQAKTVISVVDAYDETLVTSLKKEVTETKRVADDLEKKYHKAAEELDDTQTELEEVKRKNAELEKKLEQALKGIYEEEEDEEPKSYFLLRDREFREQNQGIPPNSNQGSRRPSHAQRQQSIQESSPEEEDDSSSGEEGEDEEAKQKRRNMRELKMMNNKLKNVKEKMDKAKKERAGLKVQLKNQQAALKVERKKYKALKKEVDKMAKMMKDTEEDEEEEDEDEDEEDEDKPNKKDDKKEEEEEEEASEEETETETEQETESDTESESEEEDAPVDKKKENLATRVKKHESALNALKKGNYLIIANIDRLKDDVMKQKEECSSLQEDLDSVLAELE